MHVYVLANSELNHLVINGSAHGLVLASVELECSDVHIYGSLYGVSVLNAAVNISDCTFSTAHTALRLVSSSTVALTRCLVEGGEYGVYSHSTHHSLNVTDCMFRNITASAVRLEDWYYDWYYGIYDVDTVMPAALLLHRNLFSGSSRAVHIHQNIGDDITVEVSDNVIESGLVNVGNEDIVSGVYINLEAVGNQAHIKLERNAFRSLPYPAISISRCHSSTLPANHSTAVIGNNFTNISATAVEMQCADTVSTVIQSNTFLQNIVNDGPSCLNISLSELGNRSATELRIDGNEFRENSGTHVVRIVESERSTVSSDDASRLSEFVSNTLVDNFPHVSTVYSEYSHLRMHFNTFSNQRARFELRVGFPADQVANCTYNSWGVSTEDGVATRIFDNSDVASVGSVVYLPFLNSSDQFNCAELSDCSGHGSCIHSDTCLCDAGWSAVDCSQYSCADVYDCGGRGQCVGPNLCQCDNGWLPHDCRTASCVLRNNCSERGVCSLPNV